jgi:DNA-directed RNA polymerase subunit H (RpoH/RPB5)
MSGIVVREAMPFSRTFFERVPLRFINLDELARGSLEDRNFVGDAYWQIDAEEPLAYLILRNGRPYRIFGYSGPSVTAFINWLRRDKRELTLTYRFVEEGSLPHLVRCCSEDPVVQDLENGSGDLMEVLRALRRKGESGLLRIRAEGSTTLVPIENGRLQVAYGPGLVHRGKAILEFLTAQLPTAAVADLYPGSTKELPAVGISEAVLLVKAFNSWLEAARPTWPDCPKIAAHVFKTVKDKESCMAPFHFEVEEGLSLETLPVETDRMTPVFASMIRSMCKKHPSPGACSKLFVSSNRQNRMALEATGLGSLLELDS